MKSNLDLTCFVIVFVASFVRDGLSVSNPFATRQEEFCYNPDDTDCGPSVWHGECSTGDRQSPIDVNYKKLGVFWNKAHLKFSPTYFHTHSRFFATNTGHSFRVQLSSESDPMSDLTISGKGLLEGEYRFAQLHFHWGQRDDEGSEHTLMGRRYPMELHIVHYKSKYGSFSNAMSQEDAEAVAVFAVFFELGAKNTAIDSIVEAASSPQSLNSQGEYEDYRLKLNIRNLLPAKMKFASYMGSLTTPPCTQTVSWVVFLKPVSISAMQLNVLRQLHNGEMEKYFNFRPVQPINERRLTFYKAIEDPVFPIFHSLFELIKKFVVIVLTAIRNLSLFLFKPVVIWDEGVTHWLFDQKWFLNGFIGPPVIGFSKRLGHEDKV